MKIGSIKVVVTSPGRNYVTVKIEAEDGTYGIGDATLNGRELAVAAYLSEHVVPLLIGREAGDIEAIWQFLYRGSYWRRGPVTMAAIAGVDMALWDIKGKVLGTPVWDLLGGRCRQAIRVYTHASSRTIDGAVDEVRRALAEGYEAVRVQCLVPGIDEMYGVPARRASLSRRACRSSSKVGRPTPTCASRQPCLRPCGRPWAPNPCSCTMLTTV